MKVRNNNLPFGIDVSLRMKIAGNVGGILHRTVSAPSLYRSVEWVFTLQEHNESPHQKNNAVWTAGVGGSEPRTAPVVQKIFMACLISKVPSPSVFSTEECWSRWGASAQYNGVPLLRKLMRSKGTTAWLDNPGSQGSQKPARCNTTQTGQNNGQLPHWFQPA